METNTVSNAVTGIQDFVLHQGTDYGLRILGGVATLIIGWWVAKFIRNLVFALMTKRNMDPTIAVFLRNLIYTALMVFVLIASVGAIGVQTTSFVAVIGAAGLAVGLALQGSLANFAAGFLLIVFRPFKKGDYIEGGGTAGTVDEIQLFTTILKTPDNKKVIVPNGKLSGDNVINYTAMPTRRLDLVFGVAYSDEIEKVKRVLLRVAGEDPRIHKDPAPMVAVNSLGDSSVNVLLRVWLKTDDYAPVQFDTTEKVKKTFDNEGITIPFPRRDLHVFQARA